MIFTNLQGYIIFLVLLARHEFANQIDSYPLINIVQVDLLLKS